MQKHLLVVAVILTASTGCDNVEFGGFDIALKGPESATEQPTVGLGPIETVEYPKAILLAGLEAVHTYMSPAAQSLKKLVRE